MNVQISPDEVVYWKLGWLQLNATIVNTWITMAVLVALGSLVSRGIRHTLPIPRLQGFLEIVIVGIRNQIREISQHSVNRFLPFIGTLFLLIAAANLLAIVPLFKSPTASLSTTVALATCVFFAVPVFGIRNIGWRNYLRQYLKPTWLMLPFNIIGELSRTLALAVRLYGNMMSGAVIGAVLLTIVPLFIPIIMQLLGLISGMVQAYIFAVLAMVYIASASAASQASSRENDARESASDPKKSTTSQQQSKD